jgi:plastocyanin
MECSPERDRNLSIITSSIKIRKPIFRNPFILFRQEEVSSDYMRYIPKPVHWAILIIVLVSFIALCGCTNNSPPPTTPTSTPSAVKTQVQGAQTVNMQNFAFTPATITVPKGTTVTWINQDSANHQILNDATGTLGQGVLFSSNSLPKGASYSFKFDTAGTYPYHCSIHPSMKGTVVVT